MDHNRINGLQLIFFLKDSYICGQWKSNVSSWNVDNTYTIAKALYLALQMPIERSVTSFTRTRIQEAMTICSRIHMYENISPLVYTWAHGTGRTQSEHLTIFQFEIPTMMVGIKLKVIPR